MMPWPDCCRGRAIAFSDDWLLDSISKKWSFLDGVSYAEEEDGYDEGADECQKVVLVAVSRHLPPTEKSSDASSYGNQMFGGTSTSVENSPPR
ncbi:hypothetical protein CDV36_016120 [Fusarium kuroshium]|uniref:Uncharacterized protein n=1 Tax=Fusarium kuroshium TaxID=2010991 RepID=A0A3M2QZH1_9HYPO|nr:hypothetical protein CDV36_016120 [Fusarium kuroshium]